MEIEFNSGRIAETGSGQVLTRRPAPAPARSEETPFERTQALERALRDVPDVRPEKVERARSLVADADYPPQEMLDRIANLLALRIDR